MCSGRRGSALRLSTATNAASRTTLAASETIVSGAVQECVSALENPKTSANRPPQASRTPGTSIRGRPSGGWFCRSLNATSTVGMAVSTLTYRHHRQVSVCVSTPPRISPTDAPPPAIAPKMPNALARSGEPANVTGSSDNADGASSAPNAPCSARAPTSIPKDWANPPMAEAPAKPISPAMKVHLRPNKSPSFPPSSKRLPNASAYAVTTHCRLSVEMPSDRCAEGSAMFTIVASRTTISCATPSRARTVQRRSPDAEPAADVTGRTPVRSLLAIDAAHGTRQSLGSSCGQFHRSCRRRVRAAVMLRRGHGAGWRVNSPTGPDALYADVVDIEVVLPVRAPS